ncbi:MAG: hypothetical protein ACOCU4_02180 [Alkalispirochaeta sp.]
MGYKKDQKKENTDLFGNPISEPAPDPATFISPEMEKYRAQVGRFTVQELQGIRTTLGFRSIQGSKAALVSATLGFLSLLHREEHFDQWFASLPAYLSLALTDATFRGYVEAERVQAVAGKPVAAGPRYYESGYQRTNPNLRLGMFELYRSYGHLLLVMPPLFRRLLSSVLPAPPQYGVGPCADQDVRGWSAGETLSESLPLLFTSLEPLLRDRSIHEKILRRGLNKSDIKELRKRSAFPSFPVGSRTGIDPIDLIARFVMIDPKQLERAPTTDIRDFVKDLVTTFFTIPDSGKVVSHYLLIDSNFEFSALCPHLSRGPGSSRYGADFYPHPVARSVYFELLKLIANAGSWFDADEMAESIRMQAVTFRLFREDSAATELLLKGAALDLPEGRIELERWERGFVPDVYLVHHLVTKPLLKSYCYLMAALGVLEITETEPEQRLTRKDKLVPISPADGLTRVRITPFGAWCLGVSQEKPELSEVYYEAIADRALPLITYRGQSLECKVFLERIGDLIGEDRYRVSEASFIRDCGSPADIEHRIGEFHRLIAKEPARHWEELFSRIRDRARLFEQEEPCVMIQLPQDPALRRLFLEDVKLASLVVRAEGGRIVVPQSNYKKLRKVLEEYGVLKG